MTSDRAGAHKKRILFVVEGEKTEPSLIRGMFKAFGLDDTREVVSVGTNVHEFLRFLVQITPLSPLYFSVRASF